MSQKRSAREASMSYRKIVTDDPIYAIHEYGLDVNNLEIYLTGSDNYVLGAGSEEVAEPGVEYTMSNKFIKNLQICMHNGRGKNNKLLPIIIHMKTDGGDWSEGMAIYDAIKACPNPVVILNYTHARSMSSIILQAADKRVMMPTSYFMFHEGDGLVAGTQKQIKSQIEFDKRDDDIMLTLYARRLRRKGIYKGKSLSFIKKDLKRRMDKHEEVYIDAAETIREGFADEIFDGNWKKLRDVQKGYKKEADEDDTDKKLRKAKNGTNHPSRKHRKR